MSSFSLGLALLSSLLTFTNFLILHWTTIICCACVSYGRCMAANMTPLQLFANVLCLLFVYSAFLWYYPLEPFSIFRQQRKREYLSARILLVLVLIIAIIFSATSATLYYGLNLSPKTLGVFGRAIGILSAIVVVVQWTPQIFTTFQLGSAGSLSVVMLVIQLPGCLLTVFFQAVIGGADITTWGPYLVSAINIMILIIMCTVFWIRNRNGVPEENFDILLSEDEHHVYEYDKDAGNLARKSYGSFSMIHPPSNLATPVSVAVTPRSGKLAWSLSDRNGFKGKLSAASFITSGTTTRTRAHLSGKDLLGKSKPGDSFLAQLEDSFGKDMFSRWEGESSSPEGGGAIQPPPTKTRRPSTSQQHSQRYIASSSSNNANTTTNATTNATIQGVKPGTSYGSDYSPSSYTSSPIGTPRAGKVIATPRQAKDGRTSLSITPNHHHTSIGSHGGGRLSASPMPILSHTQPHHPSSSVDLVASPSNSFSTTSSFSNSMSVVENMGGSFLIAPPPSPHTSQRSLPIGNVEDGMESDADDVDFTEDPLNGDGRSLDTPQGTMDRGRFAQHQARSFASTSPTTSNGAASPSPSTPSSMLIRRDSSSSCSSETAAAASASSPQTSEKLPSIQLTSHEDDGYNPSLNRPDEHVIPLDSHKP